MSTPFASPAVQAAPASLPVFPRPSAADFDAPGACMPLPQFGVIDVAGDDAATFLHSQLTNDIEHLDAASARLSGYCSPKGRLLGSFLTWRAGHGVRLLVSKDVQPAVQKRLSMFVLRAKAKLTDASDALAVVGFAGDVRDALSGIFDALPDGVHVKVDGPAGTLIRVPDAAGRKRYLWIGPRAKSTRASPRSAGRCRSCRRPYGTGSTSARANRASRCLPSNSSCRRWSTST